MTSSGLNPCVIVAVAVLDVPDLLGVPVTVIFCVPSFAEGVYLTWAPSVLSKVPMDELESFHL